MKKYTQKIIFFLSILYIFSIPSPVDAASGELLQKNALHTAAPIQTSLVQDFFQVDSVLPFLVLLVILGVLGVFFINKSTK